MRNERAYRDPFPVSGGTMSPMDDRAAVINAAEARAAALARGDAGDLLALLHPGFR